MAVPHRVNPPLTRAQAEATIAAVVAAVAEGCLYPLSRGQEGVSAIQHAAAALGISGASVLNRLRRAHQLYGLTVNGIVPPPRVTRASAESRADAPAANARPARKPASPADMVDRERLTGEIARLRAENKQMVRDHIDAEEMRRLVGSLAAPPAAPPDWLVSPREASRGAETPVTIWADWHAGEVVSPGAINGVNEFNAAVLERRVRRLVERTIYLLTDHGPGNYPGIVINLLGDFVSGALHPELAKTDDHTVIEATLKVRDLMVWGLEQMLGRYGRVFCPCASGNHARNTQRPEYKRLVYNSFDWLIYELLRRHFADRPEIVFLNNESNEAYYRVHGIRYMAVHGDMLGVKGGDGIIGSIGPIMRGTMKVGKRSAAIRRDFDRLLMGHWHQPLMLPGITVANTLKGYDEFAQKALGASPSTPSQPLWLVHPKWGQTNYREVMLEEPQLDATDAWVSWK